MMIKSTPHMIDYILSHNGITINPMTMATYETGYAVARKTLYIISVDALREKTVSVYSEITTLLDRMDPVGAYVSNGYVFIETIAIFKIKSHAIAVGKKYNQHSIYDLNYGIEILI